MLPIMASPAISRWSRRYILFGVLSLLLWHLAVLMDVPNRTHIVLALFGFVLHVVFGKAYSLIPSYFDRELAHPSLLGAQFPLTVGGTLALAVAPDPKTPEFIGPLGAALWAVGIFLFVGHLAWTIRDNLSGAETATGGVNAPRARIDRISNAFVPIALAYLVFGSYETIAAYGTVPSIFDGYLPRTTHLLGAGTATLLVFAIGFRLLPRFLRAHPPRVLVYIVLPAGAVGPALLAVGIPSGGWLVLGGIVQAIAVGGYAVVIGILFARSPHDRIALYAVLAGAVVGVAAVGIGIWFAFVGLDAGLIAAHQRLTLIGFLGLTIIGVSLQFYPPNVGEWIGSEDRTAAVVILLITFGIIAQAVGLAVPHDGIERAGVFVSGCGACLYGYLILSAFATRR